jgi:predicted phosphodiesterase
MRFAIFGDIHANLEALEAVLRDAEAQQCTNYVCLGDVVGYNASPAECVEVVRKLGCPVVKGNHDEQASEDHDTLEFTPLAEEAIQWTRAHLNSVQKQWLRDLRMVRQVRDFTVVHATLDTPGQWTYVFNQLEAAASFSYQHTQLCFFGHTHSPRLYVRAGSVQSLPLDKVLIDSNTKYFINVGSVGQPRDGDWRASYAVYDVPRQTIELRRVPYRIHEAQKKIRAAGLPERLAERLQQGR